MAGLAIEWVFQCPKAHRVDGNLDAALPIGILGPSAASKSHYIPALVKELDDEGALLSRGVSLAETPDTSAEVRQRISRVYRKHEVLPPTDAGELGGPFAYSLRLGERASERRFGAMLFDVAGEDFQRLSSMASVAPFVFHATGLIILLDPVGIVSTEFGGDDYEVRVRAKKLVGVIASGLEQATGTASYALQIPVCVAIAKSDSVHWDAGDWESDLAGVGGLDATMTMAEESEYLRGLSDTVRDNFVALGAGTLVHEIERRFDRSFLRYAAVSATNGMPVKDADGNARWNNPRPVGCSLPILHILRMANL